MDIAKLLGFNLSKKEELTFQELAGIQQITEPVPVEPIQAEPIQVEPIQVEPIQAEPIQAEPIQAEPVDQAPLPPQFQNTVEPSPTNMLGNFPIHPIQISINEPDSGKIRMRIDEAKEISLAKCDHMVIATNPEAIFMLPDVARRGKEYILGKYIQENNTQQFKIKIPTDNLIVKGANSFEKEITLDNYTRLVNGGQFGLKNVWFAF
jgi:hypothetical protein